MPSWIIRFQPTPDSVIMVKIRLPLKYMDINIYLLYLL